ncbi:MarR family transcriptional regulator [Leptospira kanakyensis]|uniref:MarR family transcriptional regulator n=1 Tax=Leptospira kanakyensis TaxID=2484968 RepID=A0A6N4QI11_9LEPT|nr:MarR family transcriptional regulator [Leptospira kanakyensis]TGK53979.1 MarR family transcriptional regulator [Leptospira kanakyensis]TGK57774.1 MarR family transcriptional regulator [Leptospira kanakyensis]TGK73483.1 MarR family transcriptional regulator [Leptospira kanakyensis]
MEITNFKKTTRKYFETALNMHEAIAKKADLTGTDHKYLGYLIENGEMSAGDLSKISGLTTGAITGVIDRLEKNNLVKRKFLQADRRKVMIVPNIERANQLFSPIFKKLQKDTDLLISSFTDHELEVVHRYFESATEIMEGMSKKLQGKK